MMAAPLGTHSKPTLTDEFQWTANVFTIHQNAHQTQPKKNYNSIRNLPPSWSKRQKVLLNRDIESDCCLCLTCSGTGSPRWPESFFLPDARPDEEQFLSDPLRENKMKTCPEYFQETHSMTSVLSHVVIQVHLHWGQVDQWSLFNLVWNHKPDLKPVKCTIVYLCPMWHRFELRNLFYH